MSTSMCRAVSSPVHRKDETRAASYESSLPDDAVRHMRMAYEANVIHSLTAIGGAGYVRCPPPGGENCEVDRHNHAGLLTSAAS